MTKEKCVLALDVGSKRIGIAGSDPLGLTAQPIETLKRSGRSADIAYIAQLAAKRGAKALVIGLPKNMDGSLGFQAEETIEFAELLGQETGLELIYVDERLSSKSARAILSQGGVTQKNQRGKVDTLAAAIILQSYLEGV